MDIWMVVKIALKALNSSKMRTFLTMLGIIIGVASVITIVSIGQGVSASVEANINSLGNNTLMILPGIVNRGGVGGGWNSQTLTLEDVKALGKECPSIIYVSPFLRRNFQVIFGNQNWNTSIQGVGEDFLQIRNWLTSEGGFFTRQDVESGLKVCVIGQVVVDNLFGSQSPIDQIIRIKNVPFKVIGVLESKGQSGFGGDQDDCVLIPYTTGMKRLFKTTFIGMIYCSVVSKEKTKQAESDVTELLRQRHHLTKEDENDFTLRSQTDIAEVAAKTTGVLTLFLSAIASVSLIVGGIGIMNIMLVSVTERIREIGIRMAIGARAKDILMQFLIEAVILSLLGGIIGILLGVVISKLIAKFAKWTMLITPDSILIAFLFSAAVGVFFGFYPALRASKLDPIEALRHE